MVKLSVVIAGAALTATAMVCGTEAAPITPESADRSAHKLEKRFFPGWGMGMGMGMGMGWGMGMGMPWGMGMGMPWGMGMGMPMGMGWGMGMPWGWFKDENGNIDARPDGSIPDGATPLDVKDVPQDLVQSKYAQFKASNDYQAR